LPQGALGFRIKKAVLSGNPPVRLFCHAKWPFIPDRGSILRPGASGPDRTWQSIFDELVVAILRNPEKTPLFSVEERKK